MRSFDGLLSKQIVLISGTRSPNGFGCAIAKLFVSHGATVAMLNRPFAPKKADDIDGLPETMALLKKSENQFGGRALNFECDLTDETKVPMVVRDIAGELGGISVIINNAGVGNFNLDIVNDRKSWDATLSAKVYGAQLVVQSAWPHLLEGSRIVSIASLAGRFGAAMASCAYTAANAALIGLTKDWAKKGKPKKLRSNCIAPGPGLTDMLGDAPPAKLQGMKDGTILGDICQPEDIANTAYFLSTPMSRLITGVVVDTNGGIWFPA